MLLWLFFLFSQYLLLFWISFWLLENYSFKILVCVLVMILHLKVESWVQIYIFKSHCLNFGVHPLTFHFWRSRIFLGWFAWHNWKKCYWNYSLWFWLSKYALFYLHIALRELIFDYPKFDPAYTGHLGEEFH